MKKMTTKDAAFRRKSNDWSYTVYTPMQCIQHTVPTIQCVAKGDHSLTRMDDRKHLFCVHHMGDMKKCLNARKTEVIHIALMEEM